MSVARPVRIARSRAPGPSGPAPPTAEETPPGSVVGSVTPVLRANRGATGRAVRLSVIYVGGIAAVYGVLVASSRAGPAAGSTGTFEDLLLAGILAVLLAVIGVVVALGAAPRGVEIGDAATVVVGRFGRRYRFPGRDRLKTTVLQRIPAGPLAPVPLESVEFAGGSSRRSFLIDEGLLAPAPEGTETPT